MNTARIEGRVKFFNAEKGFGFVRNPFGADQKDIFLHVTEIPPGISLNPGDVIAFNTKQTRKGTVATQVELIKRAEMKTQQRREQYAHADL